MALFFEDEIQRVKRSTDRSGLENLMSQNPRNKPNWSNRSHNTSTRRNQRDTDNRQDDW
jgi:hypothetical protein